MKAIVGFTFFLLFLAGLIFVTLLGPKMAGNSLAGGGVGMTGIDWRAVTIGKETVPDDREIFIQFDVDGSFAGNGGCNSFNGALEQKDAGIAVGPIGATRMACGEEIMSRETRFLDALRATREFQVDAGNMRLLDDTGEVLLEFVAAGT